MKKVKFIPRELPYDVNEQFKYLRTNIQFSGADKKVILVTSSIPGEGKSTVTLELAKSMSDLGKRVLLVDADLRRSNLKRQITEPSAVDLGLTHWLSGLAPLESVLYLTDKPYLNVIFSGAVPPNPSELLSANRMEPLLSWARTKYDYIFVDAAPLTAVIDAAVIAQACDASVVVIESNSISYRTVQSVIRQLNQAGKPILGAILNKVDFAKDARRSSYYKRYGYYRYRKPSTLKTSETTKE